MDKTDSSSDHGPRPPPYNAQGYGPQGPYPVPSYQVGKGNISFISPAGPYDNMVHPGPEGRTAGDGLHFTEAPPVDYEDFAIAEEENCFSDGGVRRAFIRKVYLTLMIQLLVTVGIICAFLYWEPLREFAWSTPYFTSVMMVCTVVLILALSCCDNLRRRVPLNFIALGLFTVVEGLMLGSVAVFFEAEAVMWAVGATALVSLSLTVFAMQSKVDFTAAYGCMWVLFSTLMSFALLCVIMRSQYLYITYACLGTLIFSFYLVMDTQLILGGKHKKYSMSPEEYIFAALSLYLDIVTLFLLLLQLIGLCR